MTLKRASRATKLLLSALLLAASALLLAGPEAIANQRLCAYDRPCIDALFFSNKGRINVTWTGDWDAYNVRWSVVRGGRVIYLGQFDVGRDKIAKIGVGAGDRGNRFIFKVQGCNRRFLARSVCSPWEEQTIVPVPPKKTVPVPPKETVLVPVLVPAIGRPPAPQTARVTGDVDVYDTPGGVGRVTGILRFGKQVELVGKCAPEDWCQVKGSAVPGGQGWVWGHLQF